MTDLDIYLAGLRGDIEESSRNPKLKQGDMVRVDGWIMLKGLPAGKYRVKKVDEKSYWFSKPRGTNTVARHLIDHIDAKVREPSNNDLNKIVIL